MPAKDSKASGLCSVPDSVNACNAGYKNVYLVINASRASHIPGVGKFGTGFLTDPKLFVKAMKDGGVTMCSSESLGIK